MKLKGYYLKSIHSTFPEVYTIDSHGAKSHKLRDVYISKSPLNDCQTFTIGGIEYFLELNKKELKTVIELIRNKVYKRQCIVDFREEFLDRLKETFKPFVESFTTVPFESTNGTKMIVAVIKFKKNEPKTKGIGDIFWSIVPSPRRD
jgi:hypothetical protein